MVVNIRTARLLRPDINLRDQLSHVVGWRERLRLGHISSEENSNAVVPMDTSGPSSSSQTPCKSTKDIKRLEVFQIFPTPWASDKHVRLFFKDTHSRVNAHYSKFGKKVILIGNRNLKN